MHPLDTGPRTRPQSRGAAHGLTSPALDHAYLSELQRQEAAIDLVRTRILAARPDNICYLPPRPDLRCWYTLHPDWLGTSYQLAIFLAARAVAMASAGYVLTGQSLRGAFATGDRPVAVEALAGEKLTRQTALSLHAINLLPPFAEQLYAGGRLTSAPSCTYAAQYLERFIVSEVSQPLCIQCQMQLVVLEYVCALAAAHQSLIRKIAVILLAENVDGDKRISALLLAMKPTRGATPKVVNRLVITLLETLTNECFASSAAEEPVH